MRNTVRIPTSRLQLLGKIGFQEGWKSKKILSTQSLNKFYTGLFFQPFINCPLRYLILTFLEFHNFEVR